MPSFVVAGGVGLWSLFHPARRRGNGRRRVPAPLTILRVPVMGAAVGTLGSLGVSTITERFLADWMPLLVLAGLAGLAVVIERT